MLGGGLLLLLAAGCGGGGAPGEENTPKETEAAWYVPLRVSAPAEGLRNSRNLAGQLESARDGCDGNDLPALLPPADMKYLALFFTHEGQEGCRGLYASDYRGMTYRGTLVWPFEVRSDDAGRTFRLSPGAPVTKDAQLAEKLRAGLWVRDERSGVCYPAYGEGSVAGEKFTASNGSRSFSLLYRDDGVEPSGCREPEENSPSASLSSASQSENDKNGELGVPPVPGSVE